MVKVCAGDSQPFFAPKILAKSLIPQRREKRDSHRGVDPDFLRQRQRPPIAQPASQLTEVRL